MEAHSDFPEGSLTLTPAIDIHLKSPTSGDLGGEKNDRRADYV